MTEADGSKSYSEQQLKIIKIGTAVLWIFAGASFFFPLYYWPTGGFMRALFGILAAVHLVEFFVYLRLFREVGGSMLSHFFSTMAYGVVYYTEVKQRHAAT